jgi:hypothetical protein
VIRLQFFGGGVSYFWSQEEFFYLPPPTYLVKFNKQHYVGVDSIIFVVALQAGSLAGRAFAEVYNHTDGVLVANSTVQTTSTTAVWVESGNIFGSLPEREVTLGIRMRPEVGGFMSVEHAAILGSAYLLLYRP